MPWCGDARPPVPQALGHDARRRRDEHRVAARRRPAIVNGSARRVRTPRTKEFRRRGRRRGPTTRSRISAAFFGAWPARKRRWATSRLATSRQNDAHRPAPWPLSTPTRVRTSSCTCSPVARRWYRNRRDPMSPARARFKAARRRPHWSTAPQRRLPGSRSQRRRWRPTRRRHPGGARRRRQVALRTRKGLASRIRFVGIVQRAAGFDFDSRWPGARRPWQEVR